MRKFKRGKRVMFSFPTTERGQSFAKTLGIASPNGIQQEQGSDTCFDHWHWSCGFAFPSISHQAEKR